MKKSVLILVALVAIILLLWSIPRNHAIEQPEPYNLISIYHDNETEYKDWMFGTNEYKYTFVAVVYEDETRELHKINTRDDYITFYNGTPGVTKGKYDKSYNVYLNETEIKQYI